MYNISFSHFSGADSFGYDKVYSLKDTGVFSTDSVRIASGNCREKSIIWLTSYDASMEFIMKAKEKKAVVFIDQLDVIRPNGYLRAAMIRRISQFLSLCIKYNVPYILSFAARNEMEMRPPKEGIAVACLLGLTVPQAVRGFELAGELMEKKTDNSNIANSNAVNSNVANSNTVDIE